MKTSVAMLALLGFVVAPMVARGSGSSTVDVKSVYFAAKIESVRKIFAHDPKHPSDEQDWHKDWREKAQPLLDKIKLELEKQQKAFLKGKGWALVKYDADARPCESPEGTRCRTDLRFDAHVGSLRITVVTEKPLAPEAHTELNALLDKIAQGALKQE